MFYAESSLIHPDGVYWPGTIVAGMLASEYSILMCDIAAGSLLTITPDLGSMLVYCIIIVGIVQLVSLRQLFVGCADSCWVFNLVC